MARSIVFVGVGGMGRSALGTLLRRLPDARFRIVDRSDENLQKAAALAPDRIEVQCLDISKGKLDARGADLVVNFAGPFFLGSDAAARAAIEAGAGYVDVCDDVEGIETVIGLDAEAKKAGVSLITGAGNSPGIANWIAAQMLEEDASIDGIKIVWIVQESDPGGLAVLRHMLHMTVAPCPVWRDGRMVMTKGFVPETAESFDVPEPFNHVEAYDTAHPEPITLPRAFPRLRLVQCKGSLRPTWANQAFSTLGRIGFGHRDVQVEVGGQTVEPIEVLWKLLWERYRRKPAREAFATTMVNVIGLAGDRPVLMRTVTDDADMSRGTGIGVAAAAIALLEHGAEPGAGGVERIPAAQGIDLFLSLAKEQGAFRSGIVETKY